MRSSQVDHIFYANKSQLKNGKANAVEGSCKSTHYLDFSGGSFLIECQLVTRLSPEQHSKLGL